MKINILIPFRPTIKQTSKLHHYYVQRKEKSFHQDKNGFWHMDDINSSIEPMKASDDIIVRCCTAIRKNSVYHHKITLVVESDVHFDVEYKKNIENKYDVDFFVVGKTNLDTQPSSIGYSLYTVMSNIPNEEIICFDYICDLICGKYWDKYIKEAYDIYGDSKVYVPMFIEPRGHPEHAHVDICGPEARKTNMLEDTTTDNIWNKWRTYCCHALSMKCPEDRDHMIEKDLDDWSEIANKFEKKHIIENCGVRDYGYYATLIAKNKAFNNASKFLLEYGGPDLLFDNNLNAEKVVVTQSHVFHLHNRCVLDDIEVKHE